MDSQNLQQQSQQPTTTTPTSTTLTSSTLNPTGKNIKNLSIKEFFTTRLMRARSFEGGANSPKDEASNWFDEFKARMTKKSGTTKQTTTSNNNNNVVEENDDESNDSSCEQSSSLVKFATSSSSKPKSTRQSKKDGILSTTLVKDNCDNYSNTLEDVNEDSDCGDGILPNEETIINDSSINDNSATIRARKLRQISCAEFPDFDRASINTIFNRRDSRYEKVQKRSTFKLFWDKVIRLLKWIISYTLPFNYDLPWKFLSLVNCSFVIMVIGIASKTNPDIMSLSFFNGVLCGLGLATLCFLILVLCLFVQVLPTAESSLEKTSISSTSISRNLESSWFSKNSPIAKKVIKADSTSCPTPDKKQLVDDFSSVEILDDLEESAAKIDSLLDDDDYKAWMIEFIGNYELRNKSDIKLKLIYVKIENRILYLCKPKNSHEAETASFPVFVNQRIYDLNMVKKFSACLLLPKSVRNRQKYVWSKKYPIKLEFQVQDEVVDTNSKTSATDVSMKNVQLTLFAKSCREKEEWFRRFKRIVEENRISRKNQLHTLQKRSSLQSETSETGYEEGLLSSLKNFRCSPTPSATRRECVQTSRSSNLLANSKRDNDDEKPLDSLTVPTNMSRTKSCEQLNQTSPNVVEDNEFNEDDSNNFVEAFADDSTLTRATAELFSQAMEFDNFLDSMPNLCYKDYIEKVISSSQYASSTSDWFNALTGRIFFDVFSHDYWCLWFKKKIQRKLHRIRLPYFMETLTLTKIDLGTNAPQFLNVVSHSFDSFGLSIDFDMAYSGGLTMTFETKLNLLKIKSDNSSANTSNPCNLPPNSQSTSASNCPTSNSQQVEPPTTSTSSPSSSGSTSSVSSTTKDPNPINSLNNENIRAKKVSANKQQATMSSSGSTRTSGESSDSDESESSSSSDSSFDEADVDEISDWEDYGAEKTRQSIVRFVDKIASSRYFQHATENRYIKRKLQDISNCPLVLVVQIQSLNGVLTLNVPPPQTDRIWYGFKPNPELTLKALPKMGDREVNLSHVTDWIERKLAEEFRKILVIPNMEDIVLPVLKSDHLLYVTTTK